MKILKKLSAALLSLCLLGTMVMPAMAAEEYTYTVRFFAGAQGTINGKEVVVYENLHYGDRVSFSQRAVQLSNDSKYYVKGIRESGKDNDTATGAASFAVTGDQDYVVAYGILGSAVAYTVNYVDANGNTLAPSETFYGNVGDRPVVAFQYVEGYLPQAYNLTGTLKENAAENVFTFTYTAITTATPTPTPTRTPTPTATPTTTTTPAENPPDTPDTPDNPIEEDIPVIPEEELTPINEEQTPAGPGTQDNPDTPNTPADIIDIDEDPTALGNKTIADTDDESDVSSGEFSKVLTSIPTIGKVGIGVVAGAILASIWIIVKMRKKKYE